MFAALSIAPSRTVVDHDTAHRVLQNNFFTGPLPSSYCQDPPSGTCHLVDINGNDTNQFSCASVCGGEQGTGPCGLTPANCGGGDCFVGRYLPTCDECPKKKVSNCETVGLDVTSLALMPGFYRHDPAASADLIRACPYDGDVACPGHRGNATGDAICAGGYTSALCAACESGYFFLINQCKRCSWVQGWGALVWALAAVVVVGVLFFALRRRVVRSLAEYVWSSLGTQAKTVWSAAQIMSAFPSLLFGVMPGSLRQFYSPLTVSNLNPSSFFAPACFHHALGSYFAELVFATTVPVALALAIWIAWVVRTQVWEHANPQNCTRQHLQLFLVMCYLALPSVCTVIFSAFVCDDTLGPHLSFLRADYATSCRSDEYRFVILPWAVMSAAVYPIGVNVMYALVLYRNRDAIRNGSASHIAFLHDAYDAKRAWFFEPVDSLRRISLTGFLVFFSSQSSTLVAAVLVSFCWLLVYDHFAPFVREDDQMLAEIANAVILFTTIMLAFNHASFIKSGATVVLCVDVNLCIVPALAFFQLRHAWRGWQIVEALEPGSQANCEVEWFMRLWDAGGGSRDFIRRKAVLYLKDALRSPVDAATCKSVLRLLRLPPFQRTESFGEDGMGIALKLDTELASFAVLTPLPQSAGGRSTLHGPTSSAAGGTQPLLAINVQQSEVVSNARLAFTDATRSDLVVAHASEEEYAVEIEGGRRVPFETILPFALQTLVEEGHTRLLLDYALDTAQNKVRRTPHIGSGALLAF